MAVMDWWVTHGVGPEFKPQYCQKKNIYIWWATFYLLSKYTQLGISEIIFVRYTHAEF
jgi:hypothetical protein